MRKLAKIFEAVERLNWLYGRGDLKSVVSTMTVNGVDYYTATSKKQYGYDQFRVRVKGNTVFARGHQQTIKTPKGV